jgi:NitT/TauT family transport system substrate-binding protein
MAMQIYLKNVKGTLSFDDIIDNSYAEKAIKAAGG